MEETIAQFNGKSMDPSSPEDLEKWSGAYKRNQFVKCRTYAINKVLEPSVVQNNTLHACMQLVADNHPQLNTLAKVKFSVKVELDFRHHDQIAVRPDGTVQFSYRSFGFADLKDMERLNIFQRAFEYLASLLGITVEQLIAEAKSRMGKRVHG
ncbi:MAG: hypothetical protein PVG39_02210 [Desulfobacteraceae bacterium]|jgi:hypothetical protein